jgi:hypothetical protein
VLEEVARLDAAAELLVGEEPVLAAVVLAGALRPGGGRDGDLELGDPLGERPDQRPLPGSRRAGDDEDRRLAQDAIC